MTRQPSVQDISWFIDLDNREQLDLNPPYQRRSVWTATDRKYFLDTIFRNYPCPPIFIHKTMNENGSATYHIVDGKQRIETILLFARNKISISKDYGDERLDGLKFDKLSSEMKKIFWNYSVPVDFMDIDGLDINEVFDRVNRNSRNLERQELRHARYGGWFIQESENEADNELFWLKIKVTTPAKAKRMKNVQLVSEILLMLIDQKITGFDQNYLDERYAELDTIGEEGEELDLEDYNMRKAELKRLASVMEDHNNCISMYAKTNNNLYTLFAFLILNYTEKTDDELADAYKSFIELVDTFRQSEDAEQLFAMRTDKPLFWENAYKYYENSRGANTDYQQRKARLDAITPVLS